MAGFAMFDPDWKIGLAFQLAHGSGGPPAREESRPMSGPQPAPAETSTAAEPDPLLGRVLNDRYKIVEAIGHGGMGRVYKALQAPLDRVVALKILGAGHDRDPNFYKRFFLEASVTARLTHPNTITLYDYGRTDDGIFFIAMEFLDGRTLSQTMQADGPLAQDRVIHIVQQICRSLREAHALGIIHRDLKPANVMLLRQQPRDRDHQRGDVHGLASLHRPRASAEPGPGPALRHLFAGSAAVPHAHRPGAVHRSGARRHHPQAPARRAGAAPAAAPRSSDRARAAADRPALHGEGPRAAVPVHGRAARAPQGGAGAPHW